MRLKQKLNSDRELETGYYNLFDSGASIAELAAFAGVTGDEVRQYHNFPPIEDCIDNQEAL